MPNSIRDKQPLIYRFTRLTEKGMPEPVEVFPPIFDIKNKDYKDAPYPLPYFPKENDFFLPGATKKRIGGANLTQELEKIKGKEILEKILSEYKEFGSKHISKTPYDTSIIAF